MYVVCPLKGLYSKSCEKTCSDCGIGFLFNLKYRIYRTKTEKSVFLTALDHSLKLLLQEGSGPSMENLSKRAVLKK
jgi:hypothetical protein